MDNYRIEISKVPLADALKAFPQEMIPAMMQLGFRPELEGDFEHWIGQHHWTGPMSDALQPAMQSLWQRGVSEQVAVQVIPIG